LGWAAVWLSQKFLGEFRSTSSIKISNLAGVFSIRLSKEPWDFSTLLAMTKSLEASDPRDKIFGMLALCKETWKGGPLPYALVPNYRKHTSQVSKDVTRYLITMSKDLSLMAIIYHWNFDSCYYGENFLPSWAFGLEKPSTEWDIDLLQKGRWRFNNGWTSKGHPAVIQTSTDDDSLILQGLAIGQID
jgi:hypothetical protein